MKICIVGAGSTGGYLGFKLIEAGLDVSLVARGAHLSEMKKNGLTIIENDKNYGYAKGYNLALKQPVQEPLKIRKRPLTENQKERKRERERDRMTK